MKFDNRNLRVNGFTPRRWASSMLVVLVSLNANILQAGEKVDDLVLTEMQAVAIAVRDNLLAKCHRKLGHYQTRRLVLMP